MDVKTTVLNSNANRKWSTEVKLADPNPPFPFVPGQQFSINITATDTNVLAVSNCFAARMAVWMDGLMGGWMYVWMGGWMDRWVGRRMDEWIDILMIR